jgi:ElaA protein
MIDWRWIPYDELTTDELYEALMLRQDVFIMEQTCVYRELDGHDKASMHLFGRDEEGALVAYLRILPPGEKFDEPSIGRVVTHMCVRNTGVGKALMLEGIRKCREIHPGHPIRITAQHRLQGFYEHVGFRAVGVPYMEVDGIMHVEMLHPAS